MSNTIKVPHTINFLAEINIDKVPASLLPILIKMSESELTDMVKQTTTQAIKYLELVEQSNEGGGWAILHLAD